MKKGNTWYIKDYEKRSLQLASGSEERYLLGILKEKSTFQSGAEVSILANAHQEAKFGVMSREEVKL